MTKVISASAVLILAILLFSSYFVFQAKGSVVDGGTYSATTTTSTLAGVDMLIKSTTIAPVCTVGSIVIASSSATAFTVKNATSTTDVSSTTLAVFEANAAEGTYTFDADCSRGIVLEPPAGFNGFFITTYR